MNGDQFDRDIRRLESRTLPLARLVHCFASQLDSPELRAEANWRGFRYDSPDHRHFCLLRSCRIVSALNAAIALAKSGYPQEIGVLLRTVSEYISQVDFILLDINRFGRPMGKAAAFLEAYFDDVSRPRPKGAKQPKLKQEEVHRALGAELDVVAGAGAPPTRELLSDIYFVFSNYVHGRYPETMDLFGGRPGRFHLHGMLNTPKDAENIELIDAVITAASNCLIGLVQTFNLEHVITGDEVLRRWVRGQEAP